MYIKFEDKDVDIIYNYLNDTFTGILLSIDSCGRIKGKDGYIRLKWGFQEYIEGDDYIKGRNNNTPIENYLSNYYKPLCLENKLVLDFDFDIYNDILNFIEKHFPETKIEIYPGGADDYNTRIRFKINEKSYKLNNGSIYELIKEESRNRYKNEIKQKWNEEFRNYLLSLKK